MATTQLDAFSPLLRGLMTTVAGAADRRALALTPAQRAEVRDLLTRLIADPELFNAYVLHVGALRTQAGPEVERQLLAGGSDVPWDQIAAHGFAGLSDDVLADLATSPEALEAFRDCHMADDGDMGRWYYDAVRKDCPVGEAAIPPVDFPDRAATSPVTASPSERRPRGGRFLRWAVPAGLAAGLLLGGLAGWALRGPGEGKGEPVAMSGSAAFEPHSKRGPNEGQLQLRVSSSADGFVVVIELSADRNQFFVPSPGRDIPVGRGERSEGVPLRASTTRIVFAVTETPAGEAVRLGLDPNTSRVYRADQHADLKRDLEDLLTRKGYRRFTVGSEAIPTAP